MSIEEKFHEYSLNFGSSHRLDVDKKIKVTYNYEEYQNLLLYSVILKNDGNKTIDRSKIIVRFPESANIIEHYISSFPVDIEKEYETKKNKIFVEYYLKLEGLEVNDKISLFFLVDSNESDKFEMLVRESDDNLIIRKGKINFVNDIEYDFKQILYTCVAVIFLGAVPFNAIFQSIVFIIMIPSIIRVLKFISNRDDEARIEINGNIVEENIIVNVRKK